MVAATTPRLDVLTMGRVSVDLYPEQVGVPLRDVARFRKMLGGSPTNVAVASARLGLRSAVITAVGRDGFGDYVRSTLDAFGVATGHVGEYPTLRTPLAFCEIFPPDHFPLLFYREPTAPDLTIEPGDIDLAAVGSADLFWTTGTGLSAEPSRSATLTALDARSRQRHTVHDLDHRPDLWPDPSQARGWQREALRHATVAVGNRAEVAVVVDDDDPLDAARALLDLGLELAVVKLGPRRRPGRHTRRRGTGGAAQRRGRQRSRSRRRLRRRTVSRLVQRVAVAGHAGLRQRCWRTGRVEAGLRRRHAEPGGGRRRSTATGPVADPYGSGLGCMSRQLANHRRRRTETR